MILVSFFEIFASIRVLKISKSPLSRCRACPWLDSVVYCKQNKDDSDINKDLALVKDNLDHSPMPLG